MQFNTWEFLYFGISVLCMYWLAYKKVHFQNFVLLAASYFFYGWMHIAFPLYLLSLSVLGFTAGFILEQQLKIQRKFILVIALILTSSCLVVVKYANFIITSFNTAFTSDLSTLQLLIPVGLSFYTFSTIGYIVDVYRGKTKAETNFLTFNAYTSFFAYLLAGPIPTSTETLPQFKAARTLSLQDVEDAAGQILWGLFKKMVVADNIGLTVNYCFARSESLNSLSLYLGIVLFSFQIYADFSGYSEIARGVAKLFGINLFNNFKMPFFSRNPGEYWRRWHISLMRWLSSYIYIPLGGRSENKFKYIYVILVTFTFSGLWHGANWTYVLWGLLNGLYFIPYIFLNRMVRYTDVPSQGKFLPTVKEAFQIFLTFNLITFSRVLFKAKDLAAAVKYYNGLFFNHTLDLPAEFLLANYKWCLVLVIIEWIQRGRSYVLDFNTPRIVKLLLYGVVIALIIFFHKEKSMQEYYYFRF